MFGLAEGETCSYTMVSPDGAHTLVEVECFENGSADGVLGPGRHSAGYRASEGRDVRLLQSQRTEAIANMSGGLA